MRFDRESEFGVFKMGEWLRIAYFPTSGFSIILVIPTTFRKESSNFSPRVSNLPFQYGKYHHYILLGSRVTFMYKTYFI